MIFDTPFVLYLHTLNLFNYFESILRQNMSICHERIKESLQISKSL